MADQRLTDKGTLAVAPADGDWLHIIDISDLTSNPAGTSKKIALSTLRTLGNNQAITFNTTGSIRPNGTAIDLDYNFGTSILRVRNSSSTNILTLSDVGNMSLDLGDLTISKGDVIISVGDITVTLGGIDVQAGNVQCQQLISNGTGNNTFAGNILIGNLTIDETNNRFLSSGSYTIDTAGALTLSASTFVDITGGTSNYRLDNVGHRFFNNPATFDTQNIGDIRGIEARTDTVDPTTAEVTSGYYIGWYNSTLGEFRIWYNEAGTMRSSAAFT